MNREQALKDARAALAEKSKSPCCGYHFDTCYTEPKLRCRKCHKEYPQDYIDAEVEVVVNLLTNPTK